MFRRVIASVSRASFSAAARLSAQPRRWTSLAVAGAAACAVSAAVAAPAAFIAFADAPRERTFVMIKPDAVNRRLISEIIGRFEKRGFKIVAMRFLKPSREMAEAHYAEHKGRPFFNGLVDFLTSGPVVALVVEGDSAVSVTRSMLGVTKPSASPTGSLRGDLALTVGRNIVHASDSLESSAREQGLWFTKEEIVSWTQCDEKLIYE